MGDEQTVVQSANLTIRLPEWMELPMPEYADPEAVVREELLSWQVRPEENAVYFLSLLTGDLAACRETVDAIESVQRVDFEPVDSDTFYVYAAMDLRTADSDLMAAFDAPGLVVIPPMVYTGTDTVQVTVLGEEAALSGLLESFPEEVAVTVDRVGDHARLGGSLAGRLTRRQFEALAVARESGYYEVPRETSLADVATELGVSESAASSLLRKAERALVDAAIPR